MTFSPKSTLPRLARDAYRGYSSVFWTHTFENRATGWLTGDFHARFREVLLHAGARYSLACPLYVLMPDHWHLLWMGLADDSDQGTATSFLRKCLKPNLLEKGAVLQDRPHDHVLRGDELLRSAFVGTCEYIRENPARAKLVENWEAWPHLGAMVPGYPVLDPRQDDYWERYWNIYNRVAEPGDQSLRSRAGLLPIPPKVARPVKGGTTPSP